jgi:hypothetical protein
LKRLENETLPKNPTPYVGGIDVAKLAKERGVISDARLGLADVCAIVLGVRLDKPPLVRISSTWDSVDLSHGQVEYAVSDALVPLQIYQRLSQISAPAEILDTALPGTPVSVLQDDGQTIAYGILSQEPRTSTCRGINYTATRARVTIQSICIPAAILPLHKAPLASLGPTPFDVLIKRNKLQTCPQSTIPPPPPPPHSSPVNETPPSTSKEIIQVFQFLSQPVAEDADWTAGVDDPPDITEGPEEENYSLEKDLESVKEGLKLLQEIEANPSAWPTLIRTRIIMDIWHAMARIKIAKEHGCRRPFARALRDAIFIPDEEDKLRVSSYLASIGSSWDDVLQFNAWWL